MKLRDLLKSIIEVQVKYGTSKVFLCGGICRDRLLNRIDKIEDVDLTTGDKSVQILSREVSVFLAKNYNTLTKRMDDGHSSIFLDGFKLDFSSNFNTPGVKSILEDMGIKNPTDMQKELFSRDFTCNAILMSLDLKETLDPTGLGISDIKNKVIRTCLPPEITLTCNKNRVVRAIYLAAKLGFELDKDLFNWIKKNPEMIRFASERALVEKLNKAMISDKVKTLSLLDNLNLWQYVPITNELAPHYKERFLRGKA